MNGASAGKRTRINCLEGNYADHYTTDACVIRSAAIAWAERAQSKSLFCFAYLGRIGFLRRSFTFLYHRSSSSRRRRRRHGNPCSSHATHKSLVNRVTYITHENETK